MKYIGILGVGGVGGYFGGKLCRLRPVGQNILFLARGAHLEAIRRKGLRVQTANEGEWTCHPTVTSDDIRQFPDLDFCLVTVKGFDLEDVTKRLAKRATNQTVILPLLNGIDIDARIRALLPDAIVLPGCVYISSHIEAPGVVSQTGGSCKIIFGKDPRHPETPPDEVTHLFKAAGINYAWVEDPHAKIWEKFLFIAPFSLVTACYDKTIGEVIASPELSGIVRSIMDEIVQLAGKSGISLPEGATNEAFEKAKGFPEDTRTSFQNDFAKPDKRDEREIFGGALLHLCEKKGIDCDVTRGIYQRLNEIKPVP